MSTLPPQFLLWTVVGWASPGQQDVSEYLREENRILREQLGDRSLRFTDAQRRRLAMKVRKLSCERLTGMGTIVTRDTLLRWYRNLITRKYDGSKIRIAGIAPEPDGRWMTQVAWRGPSSGTPPDHGEPQAAGLWIRLCIANIIKQ